MHLSSIQKDISIKLNSIKDEQKKKLLKKERNNIMAQIHNIVKNEKMKALEDFEGNENNTTKMYEPVKKLNGWYPKKMIIKTIEGLDWKKAVRNHSRILPKHFLYKRHINAERISNTDVNTVHIIRN